MYSNMGTTDRIIRIAIALFVAFLYFTHAITGTLGIILLVLSGILVITAIVGVCPLYMLLKVSTKRN